MLFRVLIPRRLHGDKDDGNSKKKEEQELGNPGSIGRIPTEPEKARGQRDRERYERPVEHV